MKKITLIIFILGSSVMCAQQMYLERGKTISSFDYKNSLGNSLDNLQSTSNSSMSLGFRNKFLLKKLNLSAGFSYAGYGAIGSDDAVGNFMEWDLNYLELNAALDYNLFKMNNLQFYIKGAASAGFLVQGTQTLNNQVFNLKNQDDFDKTVFDFRAGFGAALPISTSVSIYMQYMRGKSFNLAEGTAVTSDQEEIRIVSDNISFGLFIELQEFRFRSQN